jgi:di/tricarboxylate transporter
MDTFQTNSQTSTVDKFKLGKKWFWVGIVVSTLNIVAGLVYGITLVIEKDHRKEGLIIMAWAIFWALISFFVIGPYLVKSGLLPKFQIIQTSPYQGVQLPQQL